MGREKRREEVVALDIYSRMVYTSSMKTNIDKLEKQLREASEAYYAGDPSPLSDAEFEVLTGS